MSSSNPIFNKEQAKAFLQNVNPLPLEQIKMDVHLTNANSRQMGNPLAEEVLTSNLTFDSYQNILGVGTSKGEVILFSFRESGKSTRVRTGSDQAIIKVALFTN